MLTVAVSVPKARPFNLDDLRPTELTKSRNLDCGLLSRFTAPSVNLQHKTSEKNKTKTASQLAGFASSFN
jgi:hypothetical protein